MADKLQPLNRNISQSGIRNVFLLLGVPIFSALSAEELVPVAEVAREVTFMPWEVIYREGEPGQDLFIIIDGEVTLLREGREIALLGKRDFLGELSVLDNAPRIDTAIARRPSTLLAIDSYTFERLLHVYPALCQAVIHVLTDRLRKANQRQRAKATAAGGDTG